MSRLENLLVRRAEANHFPPVFITGSCRSGTTVVYQYLVQSFRTSYFPNIARQRPLWPYLATRLGCDNSPPEKDFASHFGEIAGQCAPSDGWEIFLRWFSYFMNPGETDFRGLPTIPRLIGLFERFYNQSPFINKNNANTLRLVELHHVLPRSVIVHVIRELPATIESVLRGRAKNEIAADQFWSAAPDKSLIPFDLTSELELVVFQNLVCNRFVERADRELDLGVINVDYNSFCTAPWAVARQVNDAWTQRTGRPLPTRAGRDEHASFEDRGNVSDQRRCEINDVRDQIAQRTDEFAGQLVDDAIASCAANSPAVRATAG